jgi:predicted metal-dependent hydrolase
MGGQVVFPYFQAAAPDSVRGKRLRSLAPRMAPSALRVPHPLHSQIPLTFSLSLPQVFVHEGARQALERRIEQASDRPVSLHINDNVRSIVTIRRKPGQLRVRVHHMFLDAPPFIQEALARYVTAEADDGDGRSASALIGRYMAENQHRLRASRPPLHPLRTQGEEHDLLLAFRRVNARYFGNTHDALITWGRAPTRRTAGERRSIKLGSYSAVERLIRIHPVLDRAWVPRYFLEYIVFHEMLHHVIPTSRVNGRAVLHPPEFQEREREYPVFERCMTWEREHIGRLLRA